MMFLALEHSAITKEGTRTVAFSLNGEYLAAASDEIHVFDTKTGRLRASLKGHERSAADLCFFEKTSLISTDFSSIRIWDYCTCTLLKQWKAHHGWVYGAAAVPGKQRIISVGLDKYLRVWNSENGAEVIAQRLKTAAENVAVAPDGSLFALAVGTSVHVLDAENEVLWTSRAFPKRVLSLRFSHNGKFLASANDYGSITIWKVLGQSLAELHTIKAHKMITRGLAFSPNDTVLATSGGHGSVKLWDVREGTEVCSIVVHDGVVNTVDISPNGEHLALGTDANGKMVQLWKISP